MNDEADTMTAAYTELVEDTKTLRAVDEAGFPGSAVNVSLDRTEFGHFEVNVALRGIEGAQLSFVLGVARKYELEAREENGWLTLSRHYNESDREEEPDPAEAEVAS